jgi:hypothetical protein
MPHINNTAKLIIKAPAYVPLLPKRGIIWEPQDERDEELKRTLKELNEEEKEQEKLGLQLGRELSNYLQGLMSNFEDVADLTQESFFSLKQFLIAGYMSTSDLTKVLGSTDFQSSYKNVKKKIDEFIRLGLIVETSQKLDPSLDGRKKAYKLTSAGLFWAILTLDDYDFGNPIDIDNLEINVFSRYENDFLIQSFILNFINRDLLNMDSIGNSNLTGLLFKLKPICNKLAGELKDFMEFQNTGKIQRPHVKWYNHLKSDATKWKEFCYLLMGNIISSPIPDSMEGIEHPFIDDRTISFTYKGIIYSIAIINRDRKKYDAVLSKNNKQYDTVAARVLPHCILLYKIKFREEMEDDYMSYLGSIMIRLKNSLAFDFGMSILQFFDKYNILKYSLNEDGTPTRIYSQMVVLAKNEQVNNVIKKIYNELSEYYQEFMEATK